MRGIATGFPPCHNYYSAMQSGNPDTLKVGEGAYSPLIHTDYYIFCDKDQFNSSPIQWYILVCPLCMLFTAGFHTGGGGWDSWHFANFDVKNTCRFSVSGIDICLFMCRFMQWCLSMLIFLKLHLNNESWYFDQNVCYASH